MKTRQHSEPTEDTGVTMPPAQSGIESIEQPFPFAAEISLDYLLNFWRDLAEDSRSIPLLREQARVLLEAVAKEPALHGCITLEDCHRHRDLIEAMLSLRFGVATSELSIYGALGPFHDDFFFLSHALNRIAPSLRETKADPEHRKRHRRVGLYHAYSAVLRFLYGIETGFSVPYVLKGKHPETGLDLYLQIDIDPRFCVVEPIGELPALSDEDRAQLKANFHDLAWLEARLPPSRFRFKGLISFVATDITRQEVMSRLKRLLIESNSLVNSERFKQLQQHLATLLGLPDLHVALIAFAGDDAQLLTANSTMKFGCIVNDASHFSRDMFRDTLIEAARESAQVKISHCDSERTIASQLECGSAGSLMAMPLLEHGSTRAVAVLTTEVREAFSPLTVELLSDFTDLLTIAVLRALDNYGDQIQHLVQRQFTSIHPSVAWRFQRAAERYMGQLSQGQSPEMETVVFADVYPLYAVSDIRGSTDHRNHAILADLHSNLEMVQKLLEHAHRLQPMPILAEYLMRIRQYMDALNDGLKTGEEYGVMRFLRQEIEPALASLSHLAPSLQQAIEAYLTMLEGSGGLVLQERHRFDESVAAINATVTRLLDAWQQEAQKAFPHYFDKQVTDGVDQNLYIGASMVEDRRFHPIYIKNLRLSQLATLCEVDQVVVRLSATLPVPLQLTHLIVVQDLPITISFNMDEKRFRVDGAYNTRYEIMKKRIDKAVILGSGERLTQPGKIAIVYSLPSEAEEYREYITYLQHEGYLESTVEEMELEPMQGIRGLRALRVDIARFAN